mgnify:CR=1 FL=1
MLVLAHVAEQSARYGHRVRAVVGAITARKVPRFDREDLITRLVPSNLPVVLVRLAVGRLDDLGVLREALLKHQSIDEASTVDRARRAILRLARIHAQLPRVDAFVDALRADAVVVRETASEDGAVTSPKRSRVPELHVVELALEVLRERLRATLLRVVAARRERHRHRTIRSNARGERVDLSSDDVVAHRLRNEVVKRLRALDERGELGIIVQACKVQVLAAASARAIRDALDVREDRRMRLLREPEA